MTKNIIHIVLIGEFHRDPGPGYIAREVLSKALTRKQTVIFADEEAPTSTIDSKLEGNLRFIEMNGKIISAYSLQSLLSTDLYRPYFKLDAREKIISKLSKNIADAEIIDSLKTGLMHYAKWPEKVALWNFLKANKIQNIPYDADSSIRNVADNSAKEFIDMETVRIKHQTVNILSICKSKLPEGGMIVMLGGMNHTPQLFASIKLSLQEEKFENVEIIFEGIRLYSSYTQDGLQTHETNLKELKQQVSEKVRFFTNKDVVPLQQCSENQINGTFNAPILSKLGINFYTTYTIPKASEEKRLQIKALFGNISKENPDNSLTAHIHSAYLVASIRKILGIDRYRLTFSSQSKERCDYLEANCPDMTIELESKNTCLVTFPQSQETMNHLDIVRSDEKWRHFRREGQALTL